MTTLLPFETWMADPIECPRCPKCRGDDVECRFGREGEQEWLEWKCNDCGFTNRTVCADHGKEKP